MTQQAGAPQPGTILEVAEASEVQPAVLHQCTLPSTDGMVSQRVLTCSGSQAAYAAMQATPVPKRQLDSLQRLLGELCRRGDITTLVQLPLSGNALCSSGTLTTPQCI